MRLPHSIQPGYSIPYNSEMSEGSFRFVFHRIFLSACVCVCVWWGGGRGGGEGSWNRIRFRLFRTVNQFLDFFIVQPPVSALSIISGMPCMRMLH